MKRSKLNAPFILWIGLILFAVQACSPDPQSTPVRDPEKPNIVLIITDDQPVGTLHVMETLNEELIGKGVNFTQGFVTTSLCCPSRASILTGLYAHEHGVLRNRPPDGGAIAFDDSSTIAVWLQEAGYHTGYMGKYLNGYDDLEPEGYVPPGWDEWYAFFRGSPDGLERFFLNYSLSENGEIVQYGDRARDYGTDVITRKAVDFIEDSQDVPFFMIVSYYAPHQPYLPAERHKDMFRGGEPFTYWRPVSYNEEDVSDKPAWVQSIDSALVDYMDKEYRRSLATLLSVDEGIRDILDSLEGIGQLDNTVIIYISDNGFTWGEHRLTTSKNCGYEECLLIPFIIRFPKLIPEARQDERFVLNIDLAPTIADLAGVEIPVPVHGRSLVPLLGGDLVEWRDDFLFEYWTSTEGFGAEIPDYNGIRTEVWKYIVYVTGEKELYHLPSDPYELNNLYGRDGYERITTILAERLSQMLDE